MCGRKKSLLHIQETGVSVAPILSFYYGEQNHGKLKKLIAVSLQVITVISLLTVAVSFVFMFVTMIVLPALLGVNGIWLATPAAELMALTLSVFFFLKKRKTYGY